MWFFEFIDSAPPMSIWDKVRLTGFFILYILFLVVGAWTVGSWLWTLL